MFDATVRAVIPIVTAALARRYGDLADSEDAVQDALLEAATVWPREGRPDDVRAWLTTVARRRYIDRIRSDSARRAREDADLVARSDEVEVSVRDDSLELLVLCCHPALQPVSRVALTLRAVSGLSTDQIATAFYSSPATMAQRISRAKRTIDAAGRRVHRPTVDEWPARRAEVRTVLYLMFNEGYAPSGGEFPVHVELVTESIRLTRLLRAEHPDDAETTALLALMLLSDARSPARTGSRGEAIALPDQDRTLWDREEIAEGRRLAAEAVASGRLGPLEIQAAVSAVHAAAEDPETTDWPQILALYDVLARIQPGPAVSLARAVALGMARGPLAGLAEISNLARDPRLAGSHRLLAARAGLLELAGATAAARDSYRAAARAAPNSAERDWLARRADPDREDPS